MFREILKFYFPLELEQLRNVSHHQKYMHRDELRLMTDYTYDDYLPKLK